ncbi:MAG: pilus assembly protein TadB [Lachnospiraceae bacterium]|nr:pilus assembly protein TadB [Lachnospiraceae bacterium]
MKKWIERLRDIINPPEGYIWEYDEYYFTKKELFLSEMLSLLAVWFIAFCFYDNLIVCLVLSPASLIILESQRKKKKHRRLGSLCLQFKDGINFLSAGVNAGYSIENAWKESRKQLSELYGEDADITREFMYIERKSSMNIPIGDLILDLADRTGIEDIRTFSESFAVAKKSGGSMKSIIAATSNTISEKVEVMKEIETMVAGKQMEQRIMTVVPLGIICFVKLTSPGFLDVLYDNLIGNVIMSVCMVAYFASIKLGERILSIEV